MYTMLSQNKAKFPKRIQSRLSSLFCQSSSLNEELPCSSAAPYFENADYVYYALNEQSKVFEMHLVMVMVLSKTTK